MESQQEDIYRLTMMVMDICMDLDAKSEQITVEKIEKILADKGETLGREYIEYILKERHVEMVMVEQKDGRVSLAWRSGTNPNVNVIDEWTNLEPREALRIAANVMNGGVPGYLNKPSHELYYPHQKSDRAITREMMGHNPTQGNRAQRRRRHKYDD